MNYAKMFTLRKNGLYMATVTKDGKRKCLYDRDPEALYQKVQNYINAAPKTFGEYADIWQVAHSERVGYKTAESYVAPLRRIKEQFGDSAPEDITSEEIYSFLCELRDKQFSKRSVQLHRDIINMIYRYLILKGMVQYSPMTAVELPRGLKKGERDFPTDDEIKAVLTHKDHPMALFALLCLMCGMRREEVLPIDVSDFDRIAQTVRINKAVEFIGNQPNIKPPKTDAGDRIVDVPTIIIELLPERKSGLLYPHSAESDTPMTKTQFRKAWAKYQQYIGASVTPHQLRHGYATFLYEADIKIKDMQAMLGHSSSAVTMDVYTHIRNRHRKKVGNKIKEYMDTELGI